MEIMQPVSSSLVDTVDFALAWVAGAGGGQQLEDILTTETSMV